MKRILLVQRDKEYAGVVADYLRSERDYEVVVAHNNYDALTHLGTEKFSGVVATEDFSLGRDVKRLQPKAGFFLHYLPDGLGRDKVLERFRYRSYNPEQILGDYWLASFGRHSPVDLLMENSRPPRIPMGDEEISNLVLDV